MANLHHDNFKSASDNARAALIHLNLAIIGSKGPGQIPKWCITAKPYLRAIADINYGLEDPTMCVLYALNNMTSWRGPDAKSIKAIFNSLIQEKK